MTTLFLCRKPERGAIQKPFHIVFNAEFIPNTGDIIDHDNLRFLVVERMFSYADSDVADGKSHVVTLMVKPTKSLSQ